MSRRERKGVVDDLEKLVRVMKTRLEGMLTMRGRESAIAKQVSAGVQSQGVQSERERELGGERRGERDGYTEYIIVYSLVMYLSLTS